MTHWRNLKAGIQKNWNIQLRNNIYKHAIKIIWPNRIRNESARKKLVIKAVSRRPKEEINFLASKWKMSQLNNCLSRVYSIDEFGNMRIIKLPRLVERLQKKIIPIFLPIGRISKKAWYRTSLGWFLSVYSKIWMLEEQKFTLSLLKLKLFHR